MRLSVQPLARSSRRRSAFTLIELLVVIGIIAILVSLTAAAAFKVLDRVDELRVRNDIQQLQAAFQAGQTKYQVDYFPSRIVLRNHVGTYDLTNVLEKNSYAFIKKMWPRIMTTSPLFDGVNSRGWFPSDSGAAANSVYILEGQECLVFFLGGLQVNGGCQGFAQNSVNPTLLTGKFEPTLFDFKPTRLLLTSQGKHVYRDEHGTPFAFFSSYGGVGYNLYGSSDCASLSISPYQEPVTPVRYFNREGYQIISAGKNKLFGPGGAWDPRVGYANPGAPGFDDMSNFSALLLGNPLQ